MDHGVASSALSRALPHRDSSSPPCSSAFATRRARGCRSSASSPDGALDWHPAPFEAQHVRPGVVVQLRHEIEKVTVDGAVFYRTDLAGHPAARAPRGAERRSTRVICSLWALGGPLEDRLLARSGGRDPRVARAGRGRERPPRRCLPIWRGALGELIARESAPAAGLRDRGVVTDDLELEWGPVPGDLLRVHGQRVRLSRRPPRRWARVARAGAALPAGARPSRRYASCSRSRACSGPRCASAPRRASKRSARRSSGACSRRRRTSCRRRWATRSAA